MKGKKGKGKQNKPVQKTRKEIRKEKRKQKKINRASYYARNSKTPGKFVLNPELLNVKNKSEPKNENLGKKDPKDELQKRHDRERKKEAKLAKDMERRRKTHLKEANQQEDRVIKQLEKQLNLNKRKSKSTPKSFTDDGLDYLLDFCNDENRKVAIETEKKLLGVDSNSDVEEVFKMVTESKTKTLIPDANNSLDEMASEDEESLGEESNRKRKRMKKDGSVKKSTNKKANIAKKLSKDSNDKSDMNENDFSDLNTDEDDGEDANHSLTDSKESKSESKNADGTWEDIYGRKRDKDGNIVTIEGNKYIPPAARLKQLESDSALSEKLSRLRKQLKGHLNKLAENNMHKIATQVEEMYMSNSRNDMNEMLSKLMMESIVSPVITPDRLVTEHMMFVAILHANVGTEVGAHFLLSVVRRFDEMMKSNQDVENKELDNIVLMICHLYNFKVYGSQLLYQILRNLTEKFTEKEIELILLVLRSVGFLLRKDDPVALKELIISLQRKASASTSKNSRINFMLDVLMAIKNNDMRKIPQYDPTHVEHLKKIMKTYLRKGNTVTQLNITLEDLLQVNERGKWWVVGSAWSDKNDLRKPLKSTDDEEKPSFSQKMLDLARAQRMNTDTKRSIFCIIMTAEDYLDAFEKLQRLGLKGLQAREILYIVIQCCEQEKDFNPYYAILAQKFCDYDRNNQNIVKYAIWDKLKTLESYNKTQLRNFAQFLTHLFIEKGLPLSVLKVIEFGELEKQTMRLVKEIMLGILLHDSTESCLEVFQRISVWPQLKTFRVALRLFINNFIVKNDKDEVNKNEEGKYMEILRSRAELVDKILLTRAGREAF